MNYATYQNRIINILICLEDHEIPVNFRYFGDAHLNDSSYYVVHENFD